jgi:hypothetical protein
MPVAIPTTVLSVASQIVAFRRCSFRSSRGGGLRVRRLLFAIVDLRDRSIVSNRSGNVNR